ncbi:alpha-L-glutamate ligase-like protein [Parvularcula sp. ZS-1/3]|uniref:Alpha-L-glutamate ligase-like protein n=1 Tax=Parvularcula mediterranea TaxID=2732508 RepID=A0A7Y3RLH2_9PROT|nr:alpha-L-glutamate ligase-like protein [Parvularcula mediterranea]NNU15731.1 alpha-L-glutamate ligase-like protein [Parvularcula mediterranea]
MTAPLLALGQLSGEGVLGINGRNVTYVSVMNDPRKMRIVDDKVETKRIAERAGVPAPKQLGVIEINARVRRLAELIGERKSFVVKPARGSQGNGILVIGDRINGRWRTTSGKPISDEALYGHISNILSGMYSLSGLSDVALIEEIVTFSDTFSKVAPSGVPDIRLIIYRGVPAMAMVRLPTAESDGKANLHRGGVGIGVDIATGVTCGGVHHDRCVATHPDTGLDLAGIEIPDWEEMLMMGARCYPEVELGYLGVDLVIDKTRGPLLLELNGRPGLAVQLANAAGLKARLDAIDGVAEELRAPAERVAWAKAAFAATQQS